MNPFKQAIEAAKKRGEDEVAKRIKAEHQIVEAIVDWALAHDLMISVNDGEEWVLKRSSNKDKIINAMFSTDEDLIRLRSAHGDSRGDNHGWIKFIYGNDGHDVVSDYSITNTTETIWNEVVKPLSDQLERKMT